MKIYSRFVVTKWFVINGTGMFAAEKNTKIVTAYKIDSIPSKNSI